MKVGESKDNFLVPECRRTFLVHEKRKFDLGDPGCRPEETSDDAMMPRVLL